MSIIKMGFHLRGVAKKKKQKLIFIWNKATWLPMSSPYLV